MIEPDILTEVPESLKRLTRLVARGFYTIEHAIVIDLLVRNPCMKEEDILELLKFERKQLRAITNTLKSEKFLKVRMRVETDVEGKTTRHNYYFINYSLFVNVVKYKLDHVRRKIELEERDNTSRASFKCPSCEKTFTDLEADQLFDFMSQTFLCTFCQSEVEEDESAVPKKDARTLLARFNEQIEPLYGLLRDCEDIKLAPELLEPEPTDIKHTTRAHGSANKSNTGEKTTWSGDATKYIDYGFNESTVSISVGEEQGAMEERQIKDQPVWLTQSTVDGVPIEGLPKVEEKPQPGSSRMDQQSRRNANEIETLLIIHEKKAGAGAVAVPDGGSEESSSSDSDNDSKPPLSMPSSFTDVTAAADVEEMESEEEEAIPLVTIGDKKVPYHDVKEDMVANMTVSEKEEYIRIGQAMYQDMYDD